MENIKKSAYNENEAIRYADLGTLLGSGDTWNLRKPLEQRSGSTDSLLPVATTPDCLSIGDRGILFIGSSHLCLIPIPATM